MKIQIKSTNVQYNDQGEVNTVQVHFSGHNDSRTIHINGYIPLTAEEYTGNEGLAALTGMVRQNLADQLATE